MINVTKSYLPPMEEYVKYLEKIWESGWLTNNGNLVKDLEARLADYLGVSKVHYVSNGTIALQIALRALDIHGEVITTPFSYVATTNSILWEHCTPVFADIDPNTLCINPKMIEPLINENTQAIMAVHVYGYPCDVSAIDALARKYNLKVIYDAAHAFGCKLDGVSLLSYGNVSALSFHATKLFHTVEGGALIANDPDVSEKIEKMKSFGHVGDQYYMLGVNGKNSEFHAAMGLCVLPNVHDILNGRKLICDIYTSELNEFGLPFLGMTSQQYQYNYAYYPVLFNSEDELNSVVALLKSHDILPRRYFYPSLNTLPFLEDKSACPVSENISARVLCLPLYYGLDLQDVHKISKIIKEALGKYRG